ncbi:MAG: hypothetical protein M9962_10840 [Oligoflexia bacterium]|nr:hypothetical protein [Oligoflexia bacterium]
MKSWKLLPQFITLLVLCSCGGAGGGGPGGGGQVSNSLALDPNSLQDKVWAIPLTNTYYGNCAIAFQFGSNGQFGGVYICESSSNTYKYEAIYGTYTISGSNLTMQAVSDYCSALNTKTIFWNPSDPENGTETVSFNVSNGNLTIATSGGFLNFIQISESNSSFSFIASRGCYAEQNNVYSWIPYQSSNAVNVASELNSNVNTNTLTPNPSANGNCYNLQGQTGAVTVQFAGTSSGNGWYMQNNGGVGLPSVTYSRTNSAGDTLQVYVSGNQAYASATLAYTTVAAINTYAGGQLCGIYVYNYVSGGQLSSSVPLLGPNGSAIYMQYGWQNYMLTL